MESAAAMSSQDRFLDCYEAIAVATRRMLDAARATDWTAFAAGERECRTWIERIERLGNPDALLDAAGRRRRMELLRGVLRDDAALRDILAPWLGQVDRCMRGHPAAPAV
jgi:flagellar protein FliT